ncbi:hypothetical protein SYNPS1DRAFT_22370 [Syncephalis pseudoplumigaleata]|uniref:TFIIS N-terminal domain-containing protein n=1 Tax=Syncephalis pseudoplumigaleata TaxID=1712513 RepID=A0A4P9Z1U2_9FUNG|nr:hypothetical protein SYNPS1DRAFT_22370 [Syncephalis pseudoplumigaleata]|eukprot:RKP25721.1 hypothetical protein SYNPS1DRAFT_22370 [Syncephalis pseudoplumigaleata]
MADQQEANWSRENSPAAMSAEPGSSAAGLDDRKRKSDAGAHPMTPATKKAHTGTTPDMPPRQIPIHSQMRQFLAPNGGLAYSADMDSFRKLMKKEQQGDNQAFFINVLLKTNNQAMLDADGLLVTRSWLIRARKESNDKLVKKLLELYHHLPMNIEILKESQIGRIARRINLDYSNEEIKQIAGGLIATWSEAVPQMGSIAHIIGTHANTEQYGVEMGGGGQAAAAATGDAVGDDTVATSSSIKKPEGTKQLISILKQPKVEAFSDGMPELAPVNKRPKKTVRFLPDDQLASILEIPILPDERAYMGRIPDGQGGHMPNPRAMDVAEGKNLFVERSIHLRPTTVWRTPMELKLTVELPFGRDSMEKTIQSERERSTLAALYSSPDMMPDSPAEPEGSAEPKEEEEEDELSDVARQFIQLLYSQLPPASNQTPPAPTPDTYGAYGLDAQNLAGLLAQNPV